jgi:hypothetical protein
LSYSDTCISINIISCLFLDNHQYDMYNHAQVKYNKKWLPTGGKKIDWIDLIKIVHVWFCFGSSCLINWLIGVECQL